MNLFAFIFTLAVCLPCRGADDTNLQKMKALPFLTEKITPEVFFSTLTVTYHRNHRLT